MLHLVFTNYEPMYHRLDIFSWYLFHGIGFVGKIWKISPETMGFYPINIGVLPNKFACRTCTGSLKMTTTRAPCPTCPTEVGSNGHCRVSGDTMDIPGQKISDWFIPIGSMYAIYGNIYHQYTPVMLAYIPAPWIRHGICKVKFSIWIPMERDGWHVKSRDQLSCALQNATN